MPFTSRAGHDIHYEVRGPEGAPPLLLIMGLAVSSRAWDALPERLSGRFRVVTFDNRGTGRSGRKGLLYRMRDFADDAAAVLDAAGLESAHVFGISMGGMIAQELALRHPSRVRSLALGATFAGWLRSRKVSARGLVDLLRLNGGSGESDALLGKLIVSPEWHAANPGRALAWIKAAERATHRAAVAQMLAVLCFAAEKRLARLRIPTLILSGDADRLIPVENSYRLFKLLPHARLCILPGAGHAFPLEREAETIRALEEHILGSASAAA